MTPIQVKNKVAKITPERETPFTRKIRRKSWLKLFKSRHPQLVFRVPQGLDHKRAREINPTTVAEFYDNLETMYETHH